MVRGRYRRLRGLEFFVCFCLFLFWLKHRVNVMRKDKFVVTGNGDSQLDK